MSARRIGDAGLALVKLAEALRLKAYAATPDEAARGIWTIGWGHTRGVKEGDVCTVAEAEAFLREDLADSETTVWNMVRVPLTQNQFDALVSLAFNIGSGNFALSTLLRRLNLADYAGAAHEFTKWDKQSGKILKGLTIRRTAERELFLKPDGPADV